MAQAATRDASLVLARRLVDAIEAGDCGQTDDLIKALHDGRFEALYQEIGKLTRDVHDNFAELCGDDRLLSLTQRQMPDARARLHYVMDKTEEAANRTLSAVEVMIPMADQMVQQAGSLRAELAHTARNDRVEQFLDTVEHDARKLRSGLSEVLMAQEYQDLTGQVIKRTINLVGQVEEKLVQLVSACGVVAAGGSLQLQHPGSDGAASFGPAIRGDGGAVTRQSDVDELLANLGF